MAQALLVVEAGRAQAAGRADVRRVRAEGRGLAAVRVVVAGVAGVALRPLIDDAQRGVDRGVAVPVVAGIAHATGTAHALAAEGRRGAAVDRDFAGVTGRTRRAEPERAVGGDEGPIIPETCAQAASGSTTVGCLFYAVDLDQNGGLENDQYAVAVSNVQLDTQATVTVEKKIGGVWQTVAGPQVVAPLDLHAFALTNNNQQ
ncbi:MAG: hypothetical protein HC927_02355, partial [Deltaproteobacteria bacterium]|nr:hypothetical protein [Deltaproteobacteria bacterium]